MLALGEPPIRRAIPAFALGDTTLNDLEPDWAVVASWVTVAFAPKPKPALGPVLPVPTPDVTSYSALGLST